MLEGDVTATSTISSGRVPRRVATESVWIGVNRVATPDDPQAAHVQHCLDRLAAGDDRARDDLVGIACSRMEEIAHRMLRRFPVVRRWDETGDVAQNAVLRLYNSLAAVRPADGRSFLGFLALQVRRELLDLARKYSGPESFATHQETNFDRHDGDLRARVDAAESPRDEEHDLDRWTDFHEAVERLPPEEREVFHLHFYLGMQHVQAGELLGCSERTIKRLWSSARVLVQNIVRGDSAGAP